jgi:cation transport protein ChaC
LDVGFPRDETLGALPNQQLRSKHHLHGVAGEQLAIVRRGSAQASHHTRVGSRIRKDDISAMWIFGYGSLMFDGWEAAYGCTDRKWADLPRYKRSFNKKSVNSRGTSKVPGLTLNLTPAQGGACRGIAFAFEDNEQWSKILRCLEKREACKPRALTVQLEDGRTVTAEVFIYEGPNLVDDFMLLDQKANMAVKAAGIRGSNFDYVRDTYEGLKTVGVDDPAVTALWTAIKKHPGRPKASV